MKAARFWILWVVLLCMALTQAAVANDVVTLNSGEEISGLITSKNLTQLVIVVSNAGGTIFTTRTVSKSDVKSIQRETVEGSQEPLAYEAVAELTNPVVPLMTSQERLDYEAGLKYRLAPDQELTAEQYDAGMVACQKFLEAYPASEYAAPVRQLGVQLQQEKEQVEKELVKFDNRWMSASQKSAEKDLRVIFDKLQRMQRDLASLEKQCDPINADIANDKPPLDKALKEEADAKDIPSRNEASAKRRACFGKLQRDSQLLVNLKTKIGLAGSDLSVAQRDCDDAKNKVKQIIDGEAFAAKRLARIESQRLAEEKERQDRLEKQRQEDAQLRAKVVPGKVTIIEWSWRKEGFGTFMTATFTIANGKDSDIKDITIRCVHTAKSGTRIDSNTRTIYDIIKAGEIKTFYNFDMVFIHSQAVSSSAIIEDFETVH